MKRFSRDFKTLKILLFGWGIVVPLSYLVPQKKNLVLFIGKNEGLFFDNVKYLYLYVQRLGLNKIEFYFFTENKSVYEMLKRNNLPVLLHPTLRSIFTLIRTKAIVVCSEQWRKKYKYHLLIRAKIIQLWHGIPLKKIGLFTHTVTEDRSSWMGRVGSAIRGKNYIYDLFISTSEYFTRNIFSKAVRARNFMEPGYPRNDIFFKEQLDELDLLESDTDSLQKINEFRKKGFKSILYAPTWDDPMGNAVRSGFLDLAKFSEFAQKQKIIFIFKFHPSVRCVEEFGVYDNIIYYDCEKDIQPLLKATDILVTDYSSVYMDYLLLDRPVVFFPYNYDKYMESQKGLLFEYKAMVPGPICYSQDRLHDAIANYVAGRTDEFAGKRAEIRKLAFKYEDGNASQRIWDFIMKHYLTAS